MKDITGRFLNGKRYKTIKAVQLTHGEFLIDVHSTDGRVVTVIFHASGETEIKADNSARLVHN